MSSEIDSRHSLSSLLLCVKNLVNDQKVTSSEIFRIYLTLVVSCIAIKFGHPSDIISPCDLARNILVDQTSFLTIC
ncbi:protein of unknown function [Candidatus Nitrosocosmicus franklandus]|uniref:Uncharacterized protein n=1 Tax=Candidatus Nitrosocosmicus franklandianus TaxID=1798806 RepID=A0A484I851_9ARCH|nr:protein of unknown function [Candidatus Nitrosocosmicus franklandus]